MCGEIELTATHLGDVWNNLTDVEKERKLKGRLERARVDSAIVVVVDSRDGDARRMSWVGMKVSRAMWSLRIYLV